jgi:hypothetical protein
MLLAAIGGLASMIAGAGGHYHADYQTPKRKSGRTRLGRGNYGASLIKHFNETGINWSAKKNGMTIRQNRMM